MFAISYAFAELRRRSGRTLLTALGLGVGVGLVVAVSALSRGLDRAQQQVLEPLTGVGSDLSVTRPIDIGDGGMNLTAEEERRLREENGGGRVGLRDLGKPGESFSDTQYMTTQLSFDAARVREIAAMDGVEQVAGQLTVTALTISGTVPKPQDGPQMAPLGGAPGAAEGPEAIDAAQRTLTGLDLRAPDLAPVGADQVRDGRFLSRGGKHEALLSVAHARRQGLDVGDTVRVGARRLEVVGLVDTPLGGQVSDVYLELGALQRLAGKRGRVNTVNVRATDAGAAAAVERRIESRFPGAAATTSAELAERVGGSLADAKDLSGRLGAALAIVALVAAFLVSALLTLSSVAKRTRELGTLKAIGWSQRRVVGQVTLESVAQGALGGAVGAAIGVGAAALISAVGPTLEASVAGGGGSGPFGQGAIAGGVEQIAVDAPVAVPLVLAAVALAVVGGLLAGAAGGLRAARLRPADALRTLD